MCYSIKLKDQIGVSGKLPSHGRNRTFQGVLLLIKRQCQDGDRDCFSVSTFCALGTCIRTAGAEREVNDGVNPVCWLSALRRRSCLCGRRRVIRLKAPDMYASVNSGSGYRAGRT